LTPRRFYPAVAAAGERPPPAERPADLVEALLRARNLPGWGLAITWAIGVLVYFYQGVIPAFNADDIIQMQWPDDTWNFLAHGRWGYYLVFGFIMHSNPAPLFSTLVGTTLIVTTGMIAARILELRLAIATAIYTLISTISIYYGDLFAYHSLRIVPPLGNLLAIAGLFALMRRRLALGVVLLALAPGFYQPASELAAVVLVSWGVRQLLCSDGFAKWPEFLKAAAGLIASLILYAVGTRAAYWALGLPIGDRISMDAFALVHRFGEIRQLFLVHSVPFLGQGAERYQPSSVMGCVMVLGIAFFAYTITAAHRAGGTRAAVAALALNLTLLVAPWFLIFASGGGPIRTPFSPRSLYALSAVHAIWAATLLLASAARWRRAFLTILAVSVGLILTSAAHINELVFEQYLATQSDLFATNRIIARIEELLADTPGAPTDDVPIAVIYDRWTTSGPRGSIGTARYASWSREFIFRLIDRRFHWVSPERYKREWQAARTHSEWPARDSVFLDDGVIVVVVTK
jgi:hypothetical protein